MQYAKELCPEEEIQGKARQEDFQLMGTIRMPKKLHFLQERLPKPKYQVSVKGIEEEEEEAEPDEKDEYEYEYVYEDVEEPNPIAELEPK
jgi:hypothetical protein